MTFLEFIFRPLGGHPSATRRTPAPLLRPLLAVLLGLLIALPAAHAQLEERERPKPPAKPGLARLDFSSSDFIRVKRGRIKEQYYVGEPVVVPLTISNHTRFMITLTTNLSPRSHLKVLIRPDKRPSRPYFGPYEIGSYPTTDFEILGEINENFLLWADKIQESRLVFDHPGVYIVEMSLQIAVQGDQVVNTLKIEPFQVRVVETPPALAPMIELLRQHNLFDQLHRKVLSDDELDTVRRLVKDFPTNAITPYCYLSLANNLTFEFADKPTRELQDEILIAYQIAAKSYSAYRNQAYLLLLAFMDKQEMTHAATVTFKELVSVMPKDWFGKIGNTDLAKKYLHIDGEIPPIRGWTLLP